jgi:hypothetical protein
MGMLAYRLVRLIEAHAHALAGRLEEKVQACRQISPFRNPGAHELREHVYKIYRHPGQWLLGNHELDIEHLYGEIGARRARQHVPLSGVVQAMVLTKRNRWESVKNEAVMDRAFEILGALEVGKRLEMSFDRALYDAAMGYEDEVARARREAGRLRAV